MASTDEVIPLEYVYDEKKDSRVRGDNIFSEPYYKDDSDSNDGDPQSNTNLPSNQRSKRSKPNRRKSQYDEDNYALPDCESDGEGRSMKVVEQIRKVEEKVRAQGKHILIWRVTFIVLIILLLVMVVTNFSLDFKTVDMRGKTISSTLEI